MSFEALLNQLEGVSALNKSMSAEDDKKIQENADPEKTEGEGDANVDMTKSLTVVDGEGNEHDAVDGTELVKSLVARLEKQEADYAGDREGLMKSLVALSANQKDQADLIKSLNEKIETLGSEGRGRKSVVSMAESSVTELQKSEANAMDTNEFMAKALDAQRDGRITGLDVSIAESSLNKGLAVPEGIVRKVLSK